MADRDAIVWDADVRRRAVVSAELERHGHRVRVTETPQELLVAAGAASIVAIGIDETQDSELVRTVRMAPTGDDAVIVAIVSTSRSDVAALLRAGASDVWVLPAEGSVPDVRVRLAAAEHYARLQVEHARVGGELNVLKRALDLTGTGFVLTDPQLDDNPIVYANRSFYEITGYPLEETLGRNCRFLQGEADRQPEVDELAEAIGADRAASVTLQNFRRDGTPFMNEVHVAPVRDADGRVVRFVGVQIDVTDQRESGARLVLEQAARRRAERERRRTAVVAAGTASMDRAETPAGVLRALRAAVEDLLGPLAGVDVATAAEHADARTWPILQADAEHRSLVLEQPVDDSDDRTAVDLLVERTDEALLRVGRRMEERGLVRALRESLEPLRPVHVSGFDVEALVVPAGPGLAVGGDFIDNVEFADGAIGVVLGDVTGQGPRAAALTGLVRHTVRACARLSLGPAQTLEHVNRLMLDVPDRRRYCAVTVLRIDADAAADGPAEVTLALAGSPPGVLAPAAGPARATGVPGTLLGATTDPAFTEVTVALGPQDALVCFTDGLTEPLGGGTEASAVLARSLGTPASSAARLAQDVLAVGADTTSERSDDRAVFVLRRPA